MLLRSEEIAGDPAVLIVSLSVFLNTYCTCGSCSFTGGLSWLNWSIYSKKRWKNISFFLVSLIFFFFPHLQAQFPLLLPHAPPTLVFNGSRATITCTDSLNALRTHGTSLSWNSTCTRNEYIPKRANLRRQIWQPVDARSVVVPFVGWLSPDFTLPSAYVFGA